MSKKQPVAFFIDPHPVSQDWWGGGLTLLLVEAGWEIYYITLEQCGQEDIRMAEESARILGIKRQFFDMTVLRNPLFAQELGEKTSDAVQEHDPQLIFIPSITDYMQTRTLCSKALLQMFHWGSGLGLGEREVYSYDAIDNQVPIEIYIDISSVWDKHLQSLRAFDEKFATESLPENDLIRTKQGRAMLLGASMPAGEPVHYAEGYRLLISNNPKGSILSDILPDQFRSRCTRFYESF